MVKKPPKLGDYIVHREPYFDRENKGTVVQLLASQFIYETEDKQRRFCLFKEDWKYESKKQGTSNVK